MQQTHNQNTHQQHQSQQAYLLYCQQIIYYQHVLNWLKAKYIVNELTIYNEKRTLSSKKINQVKHQQNLHLKPLKHKEKLQNKENVALEVSLDAYGNLLTESGSSENPFGFTGYQKDDDTGLYYANARYYDSETARFNKEDPFGGDVNIPPSLHRYNYAYSNPTRFIDPDGKKAEGGHFYIPLYIALRAKMSHEKSQRFAFFSTSLDEIDDLDATSVMLDTFADVGVHNIPPGMEFPEQKDVFDAIFSFEGDEKMFLVQNVFHVLSGKKSSSEKELTSDLIDAAGNIDVKAMFVHRLGDQSHEQYNKINLGKGKYYLQNKGIQFKTGFGHGSKGHVPDSLHWREGITRTYIKELAEVIGGIQGMEGKVLDKFKQDISKELEILFNIEKTVLNPDNPFRNRRPGFRERAALSTRDQVKTIAQLETEDIRILKELIKKQGLDLKYYPEKFPGVGIIKSYAPGYTNKTFNEAAKDFTNQTGIIITGAEIRKTALQAIDLWKKHTNYNNGNAATVIESTENEIEFSIEGY